jgi:hypothetical protein
MAGRIDRELRAELADYDDAELFTVDAFYAGQKPA